MKDLSLIRTYDILTTYFIYLIFSLFAIVIKDLEPVISRQSNDHNVLYFKYIAEYNVVEQLRL